jgi:HAD superfamily hydrolase (TIGR01490 family)
MELLRKPSRATAFRDGRDARDPYRQDMLSAAVFDLDNTLVHGSSLFHFATFLARRRVISARHVVRFALAERRYVRGDGENESTAIRAVQVALGLVEGMPQTRMTTLADEFMAEQRSRRMDARTMTQVLRHQARGVPCFIATASPQELADAFARRFHMAGAFGTVAEVTDGVYTGRLDGPVCHADAKAQRVREGLARHGLELSQAVAYSDSVNDLPLLVAAGHPVAVNPDSPLRAIAERHGWPVIPGTRDDGRSVESLLAYLPFPI